MPSDLGCRDVEFIVDWVAKLTPALPLAPLWGRCVVAGGTSICQANRDARCAYARENAHLFHDLKDMPEIERRVHLRDLEELFEQWMH